MEVMVEVFDNVSNQSWKIQSKFLYIIWGLLYNIVDFIKYIYEVLI